MNIKDQFEKAFAKKTNTTPSVSYEVAQGSSSINYNSTGFASGNSVIATMGSGSIGIGTLGTSTLGSTTFSQPSFGINQGSFRRIETVSFQLLDPIEKAKLIKEFLIERGVNKLNEETAKALFLVSVNIGPEKEKVVKQPKKKLKF
jgi:hypothetical protein